ncbi:2-succinyl-5-enolpyruvyl-6-hydroxy-3-cyclohexene-1-carboxylic-acid synthase [Jeotgalibacillus sp. R-1-5s-1]|uniref:2-succinyl-5-enolpyruvyl-6-hydroxy-3- cyclohexene-1-carboxylic-acid synthase n=1 Tax=Jeotgalibacillus sp. R-1-5s-1 TaxID=2555897 RepID=UPI00106D2CAC|nr:2-succinyl-5-enolpyruvyl-6-hydroxy-3-cyclohexene-1-carboxylic-acid synthase [Jeotgalibacillus sp. R-1-5s-1]TFD98143.1 2-succinyl-5-enolpyruvyl-6-hydroxy-3-cyclohexene-1-carboxylic-acid synthase [Jeotgalibacillus sp. R-1-5s-1]
MNHQDQLTEYVSTFIEQLYQSGVTRAVISPGSRSTPLAYLLEAHPLIETHINVDERSAAFYALGMAKASGKPVAIVCTSGTAAANYFPAVVEATYARVPLIVLTADRPHELRANGAPQAIDQIHLYGHHVKWFYDMPLPDADSAVLRYTGRIAAKAAAKADAHPKGPVHLNFPFREPLIPRLDSYSEKHVVADVFHASKQLSDEQLSVLAKKLNDSSKGLIIAGPMESESSLNDLIAFSKKMGYPILADPLSGLRSRMQKHATVIETYDAFLKDVWIKEMLEPDLIIRVGGMPVSKALSQYLQGCDAEQWLIDEGAEWRDPISAATSYIESSIHSFTKVCDKVTTTHSNDWLKRWQELNSAAEIEIAHYISEQMDEGAAVGALIQSLPAGSHLVAGNSMPIRDVDTFWIRGANAIHLWANRGANGIDGVVSTALGIAAVKNEPVYLLIGDLSMFHDLNGLLVAKQHKSHLQIIVMNNNGGGIFSFLPQAKEPAHFETLFGTPPSLDFEQAASFYGIDYQRCKTKDELKNALDGGSDRLKLTEVLTNRDENVIAHRKLWQTVGTACRSVLEKV